jgi:hypothetical protein
MVDCYHFEHFRLSSVNERESIDIILYNSTEKNKV